MAGLTKGANVKATPGPWTNEEYAITSLDGSVICSVNSIDDFPCIEQDNTPEGMKQLIAEFEANANLIAAAPELLDACKFALETIETHLPELSTGSMAILLRKGIEKAESKL